LGDGSFRFKVLVVWSWGVARAGVWDQFDLTRTKGNKKANFVYYDETISFSLSLFIHMTRFSQKKGIRGKGGGTRGMDGCFVVCKQAVGLVFYTLYHKFSMNFSTLFFSFPFFFFFFFFFLFSFLFLSLSLCVCVYT